jgi:hypothetical protein
MFAGKARANLSEAPFRGKQVIRFITVLPFQSKSNIFGYGHSLIEFKGRLTDVFADIKVDGNGLANANTLAYLSGVFGTKTFF